MRGHLPQSRRLIYVYCYLTSVFQIGAYIDTILLLLM